MINPDIHIFRKIKAGNIKAFEHVFRKYYSMLCNYAFKYLRDMDTCEEVVQDLFFTVWDKRDEIKIQTSVKSYLYRSVYNNSINYLKHKNIENKYGKFMRESASETGPDITDEIYAEELNVIIESTLNQLPERSREIFSMNRFEGLKYHEIAEKLSLSVKTIEANMSKALKLFRKNLREYMETT